VLLKSVRLICLVPVLAVGVLTGCGSHPATPKSALPVGCTAADVDNILADFLVDPVTAPPGFFQSISITDPDGRRFVTRSGPAAVAHLKARLKAGEDDRMTALAVGPIDFNHVAISFRLTRLAPDFVRRHITDTVAEGTGVIDCVHQKIASLVIKPG
jgi:hypothetical protein